MRLKTTAIEIKKPHNGQKLILDSRSRFKLVRCGRRFGKTEIARRRAIIQGYQNGNKFAYYCPTYKMLSETWRNLTHILKPVIFRKDEHLHQIITHTGGIIDFWSLENPDSGRGRDYDEIIVDEGAYVEDLIEIWQKVIMPTLSDRRGKASFLSTPNGYENDFYRLEQMALKRAELWQIFHMNTYSNPRIPVDEIELAKSELPADVFKQEYLAEYILFNGKLFIDQFNYLKHISEEAVIQQGVDLYLVFDFNIINSCLLVQYTKGYIYVIREYHEESWDLERLCLEIKADYPNHRLFINGDPAGQSRSALTKGNQNAYQLIQSYTGLNWNQFNVRAAHPTYTDSRLLCNFIFKNYHIVIHPSCKRLINDCTSALIDGKQSLETWKKKNPDKGHLFDCLRYHLDAEHSDKLNFHYQ